eukprot:scaffold120695_cov20-Tisochrysis_lutea.AAC.2
MASEMCATTSASSQASGSCKKWDTASCWRGQPSAGIRCCGWGPASCAQRAQGVLEGRNMCKTFCYKSCKHMHKWTAKEDCLQRQGIPQRVAHCSSILS